MVNDYIPEPLTMKLLQMLRSAKYKPFSICQTSLQDNVRTLIKIFSSKTAAKGIALNCEIAPDVPQLLSGDPVRLNQILTNLINNAIKFTENGEVKLSVDIIAEDDKTINLRFVVQDTGIGIAEDKIESVFESFTQASDLPSASSSSNYRVAASA